MPMGLLKKFLDKNNGFGGQPYYSKMGLFHSANLCKTFFALEEILPLKVHNLPINLSPMSLFPADFFHFCSLNG